MGTHGGDYNHRIKISARDVKATQKAIDRQHAEVFTAVAIAQLTEYAKAHYASALRAGVDGFHNTYPAHEQQDNRRLTVDQEVL